MAAEYEMTMADYISVLKRHWMAITTGFVVILSIAVLVIIALPSVYESKGTILIESQQISKDLVQGTAATYADERIEVIKQRVLTRENLYKIIEKHGLYKAKRKSMTSSEVIDSMRKNITVNMVSAETGKRNNKVTIAFDLIFDSERADIAYKVTNELVTLFLDENVKARTESATETTAFLAEQAESLRKQLEDTEEKVAVFKQKNASSLPEHQQLYMASLERMDSKVKDIEREQRIAQDEIRFLKVELMGAEAGLLTKQDSLAPGAVARVDSLSELDKLKAQYAQLQGVYRDNHPTMQTLLGKIKSLEAVEGAQTKSLSDTNDLPATVTKKNEINAQGLLVAKFKAQLEAAEIKLAALEKQKKDVLAKIEQQERDMTLSPIINRELLVLQRDYENAKQKYEEVRSKQLNAKITQNLEQDNKAERFSLVEPPVLPDRPIKPNRLQLMGIAIPASLFIPAIFALLLEMINPKVRGVKAVSAMMGQYALVTIPLIQDHKQLSKRRRTFFILLLMGLIIFSLALIVLNLFVMPIDLLIAKIMAKF
jgi:polysaccharide biosynthesis transport protein